MPKWLRITSIVAIGLVMLAATGFILLCWALEVFRYLSPEDTGKIALLVGYVLVMAAGIFGIVMLARGFRKASPGSGALLEGVALSKPADPEQVLYLRLAMGVKVLLSGLLMAYTVVSRFMIEHTFVWPLTMMLLLSFVLFEGPYAGLFFLMEKKVERVHIAVALILPCVLATLALYTLLQVFRHSVPSFAVPRFLLLALEVVIFVLALQLKEQLGAGDRAGLLTLTALVVVAYVLAAEGLVMFVPRLFYSRFLLAP